MQFTISFDVGNPVILNANIVNSHIPSSNALLSSLTVNGSLISGFNPNTTEYYMQIALGSRMPNVGAVAEDTFATVVITQAQSLSGNASVMVTAENGTTRNYIVHFTAIKVNISNPVVTDVLLTENKSDKETNQLYRRDGGSDTSVYGRNRHFGD